MREANPFEEAIIIRPVRADAFFMFCCGCLFVGLSLLGSSWNSGRVAAMAIGGGVWILALIAFLSDSQYIRIDSQGITHRMMFIKRFYAWNEVHRFDPSWFGGSAVYIQRDRQSLKGVLWWLYARWVGTDVLRLTWYFVDRVEMARKLNTWREMATPHTTQPAS